MIDETDKLKIAARNEEINLKVAKLDIKINKAEAELKIYETLKDYPYIIGKNYS